MKIKMPATPICPTQSLKLRSHCWIGRNLIPRKSVMMMTMSVINRENALFFSLETISAAVIPAESRNPVAQSIGNFAGRLDLARHDRFIEGACAHLRARP
jgi:hypothetical protein